MGSRRKNETNRINNSKKSRAR